jgi:transposase-like protein
MLIVPIGKVRLQVAEAEKREEYVREFNEGLKDAAQEIVKRCLEAELEAEEDRILKRKRHKRRRKEKGEMESKAYCQKCGSHKVSHFQRNGHYQRGLDTSWGHLQIEMPQVRCECGGSVKMPYQIIQSRQRIWDDLEWEIRAEYGWGLSLRWIKAKVDAKLKGSLGLRTLNQRIHEVAKGILVWKDREQSLFPPIVRVDGIWITMLKQTGARKKDSLGRNRLVKEGHRVVVLVAQGVWPEQRHQETLTWLVADGESEQAWKDLLFQVQQMELSSKGHIELLIGDGSAGFETARQWYYPNVPFQRCIFHKLRNVGRDLETPLGLDQKAGREYRKAILIEAAQIWQSPDEFQAQKAFLSFCDKWEVTQPKAVHTLQRQFDLTLSFYQVQSQAKCRGQIWPSTLLRTTSQLERENRNFRRRFRQAVLFHSQVGLEATFFQNISLRKSLTDPALTNHWPTLLEKEIALASNFMA